MKVSFQSGNHQKRTLTTRNTKYFWFSLRKLLHYMTWLSCPFTFTEGSVEQKGSSWRNYEKKILVYTCIYSVIHRVLRCNLYIYISNIMCWIFCYKSTYPMYIVFTLCLLALYLKKNIAGYFYFTWKAVCLFRVWNLCFSVSLLVFLVPRM